MSDQHVKKFLADQRVPFVSVPHPPAFTAQEIAAKAHVPGQLLAKTVIVELDGELVMAVLPASHRIDLVALRDGASARRIELVGEAEFKSRFPGCELGAMPPLGNLFGMRVYVSRSLAEDEEIAFASGRHDELLRVRYADFARLVRPQVLDFDVPSD
jgi:Ala-tRNA(Pro) deacylase